MTLDGYQAEAVADLERHVHYLVCAMETANYEHHLAGYPDDLLWQSHQRLDLLAGRALWSLADACTILDERRLLDILAELSQGDRDALRVGLAARALSGDHEIHRRMLLRLLKDVDRHVAPPAIRQPQASQPAVMDEQDEFPPRCEGLSSGMGVLRRAFLFIGISVLAAAGISPLAAIAAGDPIVQEVIKATITTTATSAVSIPAQHLLLAGDRDASGEQPLPPVHVAGQRKDPVAGSGLSRPFSGGQRDGRGVHRHPHGPSLAG
ncbi:hypothetical protein [Actinoplanes regularis]|uniref:hypothetical protein n=1 Tax=Actinoplanes regularis TaxID=52697 RepID=UPI001177DFAE|nr:hypothetical protein [Actinoplanes regularis]